MFMKLRGFIFTAVAAVLAYFHTFDACLFDFYDHFVYPPQSGLG